MILFGLGVAIIAVIIEIFGDGQGFVIGITLIGIAICVIASLMQEFFAFQVFMTCLFFIGFIALAQGI